jgi:glucan phosphorylase
MLFTTAGLSDFVSGVILYDETIRQAGNGGTLVSYLQADRRLCDRYADAEGWARQAILNVARSGKFSSDRTIAEYAAGIWKATPCPVE